jgi:hypothetical protein
MIFKGKHSREPVTWTPQHILLLLERNYQIKDLMRGPGNYSIRVYGVGLRTVSIKTTLSKGSNYAS